MLTYREYSLFFLLIFVGTGPLLVAQENTAEFTQLLTADGWRKTIDDPGTGDWRTEWFLDGLRATVINTPAGMVFSGGPQEGDDACHGVLWTKKVLSGDLRISYTYTRTDTRTAWVNILYLHATGSGDRPDDIVAWKDDRVIPSMRTYFNGMNAYHISYAAYGGDNTDPDEDYVRVRQYPVPAGRPFSTTAVEPDYFHTGLFKPGIPYRITIVKTSDHLYFHVEGDDKKQLFDWKLDPDQTLTRGRIGLRHMYTRSARYGDFQVWERE